MKLLGAMHGAQTERKALRFRSPGLDPPGSGGAGCAPRGRTRSQRGRLPAARLVRRVARARTRCRRAAATLRARAEDTARAVQPLPPARPARTRGSDPTPDLSGRRPRPVGRRYRSGPRAAGEDVEGLRTGDPAPCRRQARRKTGGDARRVARAAAELMVIISPRAAL